MTKEFTDLTLAQLLAAYNAGEILLGRPAIRALRDKPTALVRVGRTLDELTRKLGEVELQDDMTWVVVEKAPVAVEAPVSRSAGETIRLLHAGNPKRPGSRSHRLFALYRDGMSVEEFIAAMIEAGETRRLARSSIGWDVGKGFIRLEP